MLLLCAPPVVLLGMVSPFAIRLAVTERRDRRRGRGTAVRALDRRLAPRHVPAGARPHPGDRHAADVPRRRRAARRLVLLPARRRATSSSRPRWRRSSLVPPGAVKSRGRASCTRRPRTTSTSRSSRSPDGRRLLYLNEGVAVHSVWRPGLGAHGRRLGCVPRPAAAARPPARAGRDPRQRRRARPRARSASYYPDAEIDGVELDPAVSRVGRRYFGMERQPAPDRPRRRRAPVPALDRRALRPHRRRRLPPAVRPVLPRDARVLPARPRAARARAASSRSTSRPCPDDKRLVRAIGRTLAAELPQVLEWPALRFNTIVLGSDRAARAGRARAPARARARRISRRCASSSHATSRPLVAAGTRVDRRPRARRVAHRPDDHLVRGRGRAPRRGLPADAAGAVISLERRDGPPAPDRPSRRRGARAGEHAARRFARPSQPVSTSSSSTCSRSRGGELVVAHSDDLHEVSHGAARGRRRATDARRAPRRSAPSFPRSTRRSRSSPTRRRASASMSTSSRPTAVPGLAARARALRARRSGAS